MQSRRGVSSVVSTVLMVGIVLIMAVTASVYALDFADEKRQPSPQMHANLEPVSASDGTVAVTVNGGEKLEMQNLEVVIRNHGNDSQVRLVALRASGSALTSANLEGVEGMVNKSSAEGELVTTASTDGVLAAGERLAVDLPNVTQGDRVTILVVHVPTNSVIWQESTNTTA
ncbi:type IV pilin N-terminal domain-containing protein [Haloarchaeobius amylolyticus]|uniref:type IV pilin N-terminal domain-containing protein n=1 Tax=Haloarchaeobius amylolyticus TaxID=1198296 RepID=UPI00226F9301|nr:type IV pilin N-terminal domain-containing protein [Haloarchaeobius amylolyticus]